MAWREPAVPPQPARAPLLPALLAVMAGYLAVQARPDFPLLAWGVPGGLFLLAALFLPRFLSSRLESRPAPRLLRPALIWLALAALAAGSLSWRLHPLQRDLGLWRQLPPREAFLEIEVLAHFGEGPPRAPVSGLARVTRAPPHLAELTEARLAFRLFRGPRGEEIPRSRLLPGTRAEVGGVLRPLWADRGGNTFSAGLFAQGTRFTLENGWVRLETGPPHPLALALDDARARIRQWLGRGYPFWASDQLLEAYHGIVLGEARNLPPAQKDAFRRTGSLHLFAVSGLHVGILATMVAAVLAWSPVPLRYRPLLGLPLIFAYVLLTGAGDSALRAFLMIAIFWSGVAILRRPVPFSALVVSALCALAWDPWVLWNAGFQLSYAVVAAILLYGLPLGRAFRRILDPYRFRPSATLDPLRHRLRQFLFFVTDGAAISLASLAGSAPLILLHFGLVSPFSFLLNVPLVVLSFPVLAAGLVTLVLGGSGLAFLAVLPNHLAFACLYLMTSWVFAFDRLPGAVLIAEATPLFCHLLLLLTLLACALVNLAERRGLSPFLLSLPLLCTAALSLGALLH